MRLLIAYDGSTAAEAAVTTSGALFAGAVGRVLTLFDEPTGYETIAPSGLRLDGTTLQRGIESLQHEIEAGAREVAQRGVVTAKTAGLDVEATIAPMSMSPWGPILTAADELDADAVVCGSRGRGGAARSLLGSTSSSVIHHSTRPVLVVPDVPPALDGPVVVGYDGSPESRTAVATAGRLLAPRRAIVINVWRSPIRHSLSGRVLEAAPLEELRGFTRDYEDMFEEAAASMVHEGVALALDAGLDADGQQVESGSGAWRALADAAERHGAVAIVAGSRRRGAVASTLLGSVSSGLVHNAGTPALIVP
jgi:nucleotide-binding universal stress UspA family protein